jgi:hypothetical protein
MRASSAHTLPKDCSGPSEGRSPVRGPKPRPRAEGPSKGRRARPRAEGPSKGPKARPRAEGPSKGRRAVRGPKGRPRAEGPSEGRRAVQGPKHRPRAEGPSKGRSTVRGPKGRPRAEGPSKGRRAVRGPKGRPRAEGPVLYQPGAQPQVRFSIDPRAVSPNYNAPNLRLTARDGVPKAPSTTCHLGPVWRDPPFVGKHSLPKIKPRFCCLFRLVKGSAFAKSP